MPGVKRSAPRKATAKTSQPPLPRRERARRTRLRIIAAAHARFVDHGYTGATMADIAADAGVAVQTVYFTFHTKAELLQECYSAAVLGPDALPPPMQPWHARFRTAKSGAAALREWAEGNTAIAGRIGALDDIVRSAAHEPEAVAVRAHNEQLRREGYRGLMQHLADRFGLADGYDVDTATDVMLTLGGAPPYRSLVLDYGWTEAAFVDWLTRTLTQLLKPRRTRGA
jgi:AcrR family transcriptional regulator